MAKILALAIIAAIFVNGITNAAPDARISAGWEATPGQIGYQLSLRLVNFDGGVAACGGALIHAEWALSAAHCTANRVALVIRAGATDLTKPEAIFETTTWYQSPGYVNALSHITQINDISLISLETTLKKSDRLYPIRIQRFEDRFRNYHNEQLVASGWGQTYSGSSSENLQWVYLRGITNFACQSTYNFPSFVVDSTLCTIGMHSPTQGVCNGDNGGPLTLVEEDGRSTLIGISSFMPTNGCTSGFPAGFIRPGFFHLWLQALTGVDFNWDYSDFESSEESSSESSESIESSGDGEWTENSMEGFFMPVL